MPESRTRAAGVFPREVLYSATGTRQGHKNIAKSDGCDDRLVSAFRREEGYPPSPRECYPSKGGAGRSEKGGCATRRAVAASFTKRTLRTGQTMQSGAGAQAVSARAMSFGSSFLGLLTVVPTG